MANKSTLNDVIDSQAAAAITLTAKNRGDASTAVTAVAYSGSDLNRIALLETAAGVSTTVRGSDDKRLADFTTAVAALTTL